MILVKMKLMTTLMVFIAFPSLFAMLLVLGEVGELLALRHSKSGSIFKIVGFHMVVPNLIKSLKINMRCRVSELAQKRSKDVTRNCR